MPVRVPVRVQNVRQSRVKEDRQTNDRWLNQGRQTDQATAHIFIRAVDLPSSIAAVEGGGVPGTLLAKHLIHDWLTADGRRQTDW